MQVRAGADVREGEWVSLWNGKEGRGEERSDTSVQVVARLSTLSSVHPRRCAGPAV